MTLTIRLKLLVLAGVGIVMMALLALIGHRALSRFALANASATVLVEALQNQQTADMMHDALRADVLRALAITEDGRPDPEAAKDLQDNLEEHVRTFQGALASNASLPLPGDLRRGLGEVAPTAQAYLQGARAEVTRIFQDRRAGKAAFPSFQQAFADLEGPMAQLSERIEASNRAGQKVAAEAGEAAKALILGSALAAAVLLGGLSALVGRSITRPLDQLREGMAQIAEGDADLTRRLQLTGEDELADTARAFNQFVASLCDLVGRLQAIAGRVADAATQIADGNQGLQGRTEQQAASLEQTASSLSQLTDAVANTAHMARAATQSTDEARGRTESGRATAELLLERMDAIQASASRISEIVGVVDEIAFQTNLLALNAAVEAARAGEQGRGFAVVAAEVRNLALRSSQAAREIKGLIQESVALAGEGARVASATGTTMRDILGAMGEIARQTKEIAQATLSQEASLEEAGRAMTYMDNGTQQNAALVEEAAAASRLLDEDAQALAREVGRFRTSSGSSTGFQAGQATRHSGGGTLRWTR